MKAKERTTLKIAATIFYLLMIGLNGLAVFLPINNTSIQAVSDAYPNLFAPAGITFAIWPVIYTILGAFTIYQWFNSTQKSILHESVASRSLRQWFIVSCVANSAWLFSWQYFYIGPSLVVIIVLFISLFIINRLLATAELSVWDYPFIRLPFGIYFGWTTVATLADLVCFIVSKEVKLYKEHEVLFTILILLVGLLFIVGILFLNRDLAYGATAIWAYSGILLKHVSASGFNQQYPTIMITVIACLAVIIASMIIVGLRLIKQKKEVSIA